MTGKFRLCVLVIAFTSFLISCKEDKPKSIEECTIYGRLFHDEAGWAINRGRPQDTVYFDGGVRYDIKNYPISFSKDSVYYVKAEGECHIWEEGNFGQQRKEIYVKSLEIIQQ